jgi:glycosyltransferase involved in cell wall biosynthesis
MDKIKVLQAHNYYLLPGGEDTVFESEVALLRDHGHEVVTYIDNNRRINAIRPAVLAINTIYSRDSYGKMLDLIIHKKPKIVHLHNTFPLISPAAYFACQKAGVPVIQSLHNPRFICPAASFYREGKNCIDCLGKTPPYPGVYYGCYHHSRIQTGVIAAMLTVHRLLGTWTKKVNKYVVFSKFYRDLFIRSGLPDDKIVYKPHFFVPTIPFQAKHSYGKYALFIGRLDPEKGVHVLLDAWRKSDIPLKIRGAGQMEPEVRQFIAQKHSGNIELVGRLSTEALDRLIEQARFLIWPTISYYETFGLVAIESFALGVPVIASRIGVNAEIVQDGVNGLHFTAGDAEDLARKVQWAWEHPREMAEMGMNARREYETKYTPDENYKILMRIYDQAIEKNAGGPKNRLSA